MKLVGSIKEQELREELISSNRYLREGSNEKLNDAIHRSKIDAASSYILKWIPDQAEDIYTIICLPDEIYIFEIPRDDKEVSINRYHLNEYERNCQKNQKLKIAIAQSLSE